MKETHHERRMRKILATKMHAETLEFYRSHIRGKNLKILDIGAGSGHVAKALSRFPGVKRIVAYDKNEAMMRQLEPTMIIEKKTGGSHVNLPFKPSSFDVVICRYAFHHFNRKIAALKDMNRVMKSKGTLLMSDPVMPEHSRDVLDGIYCVREDHFHGYLTYCETIRLLEDGGFEVLMIHPYHYRYPDLEEYLKAVASGIGVDGRLKENQEPIDILAGKITRAWNAVNQRVKAELRIKGRGKNLSFQYYMADICAKKTA